MYRRIASLSLVLLVTSGASLQGQEFKVFDRTVQVHGFVSQGFAYTNDNNWLTMNTNSGSAAMTDMGLNVSMQLTDKLRIGVQVYDRNLGQLGQWHPSVDGALADYRFKPWLGFRGGKVKTTLGLYNITQDLDFLRPFALLPQSVYPTDLREPTIAHLGGDVYGDIHLKGNLGTLSYTVYAGRRKDSQYGGYPYLLQAIPISLTSYGGLQYGGDLRWATPLKGLLIGVSRMNADITGLGTTPVLGPVLPFEEHSKDDWTNQFYGEYTIGKLQIDSEWRRYWRNQQVFFNAFNVQTDARGFYVSGAYRFVKWFQLGSYYSRFTLNEPVNTYPGHAPTYGHIYDGVVTGRFDLNRFMNLKLEGHFMDGYGVPSQYPSGFYGQVNPDGLEPKTNALVVKTGFSF